MKSPASSETKAAAPGDAPGRRRGVFLGSVTRDSRLNVLRRGRYLLAPLLLSKFTEALEKPSSSLFITGLRLTQTSTRCQHFSSGRICRLGRFCRAFRR